MTLPLATALWLEPTPQFYFDMSRITCPGFCEHEQRNAAICDKTGCQFAIQQFPADCVARWLAEKVHEPDADLNTYETFTANFSDSADVAVTPTSGPWPVSLTWPKDAP